MEGIITRGTTLGGGVTANAGDRVDISDELFYKLKLSGDIEPIPQTPDEGKEEKPATKKKTKS